MNSFTGPNAMMMKLLQNQHQRAHFPGMIEGTINGKSVSQTLTGVCEPIQLFSTLTALEIKSSVSENT